MSDNQDNNEKAEESTQSQDSASSSSSSSVPVDSPSSSENNQDQQQQKKPAPPRPQVGTPVSRPRIGTPIGTVPPASGTASPSPAPQAQAPSAQTGPSSSPSVARPRIGTPIGTPAQTSQSTQTQASATAPQTPPAQASAGTQGVARPRIGTPIGTPKPAATPAAQASKPMTAGSIAQGPTVGTPVGARPAVGTPVGSKPAVGTPAGVKPAAVGTATVNRPAVSAPAGARPGAPGKKPESKEEISRRNFMRGIMIAGGLVAVLQFGGLFPYLQATVAGDIGYPTQPLLDSVTSAPITTSSFSTATQWLTFVYPRTGNTNIDSDTFKQCVIIKLPPGFTAPPSLSASDSTGTYCGFSRVCVHLWCLWSYVPTDMRMECPCHGSQYVPGSGTYPLLPLADNKPPGLAVEGPASLQVPPNNQLPMITLKINADGSFSATGIVGQVGCGQDC